MRPGEIITADGHLELNEDSEKNDDESAKTPEEEIIKLNHEAKSQILR